MIPHRIAVDDPTCEWEIVTMKCLSVIIVVKPKCFRTGVVSTRVFQKTHNMNITLALYRPLSSPILSYAKYQHAHLIDVY